MTFGWFCKWKQYEKLLFFNFRLLMKKHFSSLMIWLKILFLSVSIVFFIWWFLGERKQQVSNESAVHFVVDLSGDVAMQKNTISSYIDATTWQAISLAVKEGNNTILLLPATKDYVIYKTYLSSISSQNIESYTTSNSTVELSDNSIGSNVNTKYYAILSIIFALLALFL